MEPWHRGGAHLTHTHTQILEGVRELTVASGNKIVKQVESASVAVCTQAILRNIVKEI